MYNTVNLFHARFRKRGALWLDTLATSHPSCPGARDGSIRLRVEDGQAPYSYRWSTGSAEPELTNAAAGKYLVTVTDASGCSQLLFVKLKEPDTLKWAERSVTQPDCRTFGSLTATAIGGTPPYSYRWSNGDTTATADSLQPGSYRLTLTDTRGCSISWDTTLTGSPPLLAELTTHDLRCAERADGRIESRVLSGTPPYEYAWSDGAVTQDLDNLPAGAYRLTITDAAGCVLNLDTVLRAPDTLRLSVAAVTPPTCTDLGALEMQAAGGTEPYDYAWSTGAETPDINGLPPGTYSLTVTDAHGCQAAIETKLSGFLPLVAELTVRHPDCQTPGAIETRITSGTPPYVFRWSNGETSTNLDGLPPGTYSLTVTDAQDCATILSAELKGVAALAAESTARHPDCQTPGAIETRITSGTPPYAFLWSTGAETPDLDGLPPGAYSLTITDSQNCDRILETELNGITALTAELTVRHPDCQTPGTIETQISSGTPPYVFQWNKGATIANLDGLSPDTYVLTLTDAQNCVRILETVLNGLVPLAIREIDVVLPRCADQTARIVLEADGGRSPFTWTWNDGFGQPRREPLEPGSWSVTLTDAQNCNAVWSVTYDPPPPLAVNLLERSNPSCAGAADGFITVESSGGMPPYEYRWSDGSSDLRIDSLRAGGYEIEIRDAAGCRKRSIFSLIDPLGMALQFEARKPRATHLKDGELRVLVISGGRAPYRYQWSSGHSGSVIRDVSAGSYSVTVTDADGCQVVGNYSLESETLRGDFDLRPFLPDAFSPNGDGLNDVWQVELPRWIDLAEVWLYDRWGAEVARLSGRERLTWDGAGSPEGVYLLLIRWRDVNGQTGQHRGTVTVVR